MAIFRSMANSVEQNTKPSISSSGAGFPLERLGQATRHVITVMLFGGASGQGPSQRVGGIKRKRVVWRLFQSKRKKLAAPPQATNVSTCAAANPLTCGAPMGFAHAAWRMQDLCNCKNLRVRIHCRMYTRNCFQGVFDSSVAGLAVRQHVSASIAQLVRA